MRIAILSASLRNVVLLMAGASALFGQLAPYNSEGVTTGHFHMFVNDPEPLKKIFVDMLGGRVTSTGSLEIVSFPGAFAIMGKTRTPPTGGSDGSIVNHVGFKVKDLATIKAKFAAANIKLAMDNTQNKQIIAVFPEDVRVEFTEDASLATPIAFHHFHLSTPNQEKLRDWYVKMFGGTAGMRGQFPGAMFPGGEVDFAKAATPQAPSKGRSLDHIGFEVKDIEAICKKLEAAGVTFDLTWRAMPQLGGLKIAYIIDPEGTRIELTEGFMGK
jgi:catechol 2,3-dioxygenase-like lactoylglutathione lyase family enzyme